MGQFYARAGVITVSAGRGAEGNRNAEGIGGRYDDLVWSGHAVRHR
jgi:hypothetical protein